MHIKITVASAHTDATFRAVCDAVKAVPNPEGHVVFVTRGAESSIEITGTFPRHIEQHFVTVITSALQQ